MSYIPAEDESKKINRISYIARELKISYIDKEIEEISGRLLKGGFNLVFLGQFKRGKSSLINAFLGENVLPSGLVPVTAVVSVIRYSEDRKCIVKKLNGEEIIVGLNEIYLYATQEENPNNEKNVLYLDIRLPNKYLQKGLFIVDTPGISSVFEPNTMVTKGFLQNIDTAVIVLGSDPPISYDELQIIRQIKNNIKFLIYVLNKADKETDENLSVIKSFTSDILKKEVGEENPVIFCLSSKDKIEGRITYDWGKFEEKIENILNHRVDIILNSLNNAISRLSNILVSEIERYISVLRAPLEETKQNIEDLKKFKNESDIFIRELGYRFQAEQDRISQLIDIEMKKFIENHRSEIEQEFETLFQTFMNNSFSGREYYYNQMHSIAEKYVYMCIDNIKSLLDKYYNEFTKRYLDELKGLIKRVEGKVNVNDLVRLGELLDVSMSTKSDFYFHHFMRYTSSSPFSILLNIFLPKRKKLSLLKDELKDYLDWLIYANCSRYNGDINQRIIESRRKIESDFNRTISEIIEHTDKAVDYADMFVKEGEGRVENEVKRLMEFKQELINLRESSVALAKS